MKIEVCADCGGLICMDKCPDRAEDGCMCTDDEGDDE
jgi:hypothetical protein